MTRFSCHTKPKGDEEMPLTYLQLAEKVLDETHRALSPTEIWKVAETKQWSAQLEQESKRPVNTLYARMFTDLSDNPNSILAKTGARPIRYYLKKYENAISKESAIEGANDEIGAPEALDQPSGYSEADLHQILAYFVRTQFQAYAKTIKHARGSRREFGEWVHPDVIGVYYQFKDWKDDVVNLSTHLGALAVKMYSFEIKKKLSFSNLREAFFQAVSNSSWANEGYLVAADISDDDEFQEELRRLSGSFGIGIIELDVDNPDDSSVRFPSRVGKAIDWIALDKLAMNDDVKELLHRIKNDIAAKEERKEFYDALMTSEALVRFFKNKKA